MRRLRAWSDPVSGLSSLNSWSLIIGLPFESPPGVASRSSVAEQGLSAQGARGESAPVP